MALPQIPKTSTAIEVLRKGATIKKVWAVHQRDDERDNRKPEWYFDDEITARDVAKGHGWYGGIAPISVRDAIVMDDDCYILENTSPYKLNVGPEDEKEMREKH